ncbi:hypothetical protein PVK06_036833 [Gossypium arboreum]|uniref:Uncharacterized protein n=1 Tax=Gossypium arboreum TaxID=29729 RepID=A0ABR0NKL8_GOSAR|nr:hypothetical protein PVK06_036833 [Gossypium arboreum]
MEENKRCWYSETGGDWHKNREVKIISIPQSIDDRQFGVEGLAISDDSEVLVSYRDKSIYLFTRNMGLGHSGTEAVEKATPQVYKRHGASELWRM